jgi:predicted CopG family antitoxin
MNKTETILSLARKKNIAIDDDVYESLLDIGSKRDTFSDIIRKCIDAYKAFQRGRIEISPSIGKVDESKPQLIDINLPGIEFPADKSEIIKLAEKANRPDRVDYLENISNREYKNKSDLNDELLKDIKNINVNVNFRINTEALRKEQYKEKKLEQERQPIIK